MPLARSPDSRSHSGHFPVQGQRGADARAEPDRRLHGFDPADLPVLRHCPEGNAGRSHVQPMHVRATLPVVSRVGRLSVRNAEADELAWRRLLTATRIIVNPAAREFQPRLRADARGHISLGRNAGGASIGIGPVGEKGSVAFCLSKRVVVADEAVEAGDPVVERPRGRVVLFGRPIEPATAALAGDCGDGFDQLGAASLPADR
jgi:hypothetical protein